MSFVVVGLITAVVCFVLIDISLLIHLASAHNEIDAWRGHAFAWQEKYVRCKLEHAVDDDYDDDEGDDE